jgi:hypothetical protein
MGYGKHFVLRTQPVAQIDEMLLQPTMNGAAGHDLGDTKWLHTRLDKDSARSGVAESRKASESTAVEQDHFKSCKQCYQPRQRISPWFILAQRMLLPKLPVEIAVHDSLSHQTVTMPLFTKKQRQRFRSRRNLQRIRRLSAVKTSRTAHRDGRVIAVMMTTKPDPQRGEKISGDYLEYMKPWWATVDRVGLSGTVLHDGLPKACIDTATTERIQFSLSQPSDLPILHDRHRLVRDYLRGINDRHVFVTDISDVAFKRDPFQLVEQDQQQHRLFIGSEPKTIGECRCLRKEITDQFGTLLYADRQVVNPGILGGERTEVLALLNHILECIEEHKHRLLNSDMSIVNKVVHDKYRPDELFAGFPLHSRFKKWEYGTAAAILHK